MSKQPGDSKQKEWITAKEMADIFGIDRSNCLKWLKANGFHLSKVRTPDSGGQMTSALSFEDAMRAIQMREDQGFSTTGGSAKVVNEFHGVFYVCQLIPEVDPRRLKLGFASDIKSRLATYRTSNPTAKILKTWACRKTWEQTAIAALTKEDCLLIASAVFECGDAEASLERAGRFFEMLPDPDFEMGLAECSPLHKTGLNSDED